MAGKPIRIAILANGRQARAEITQTNRTLGTIGASASKAGKLLALGLGGATIARAGAAFVRSGAGYVTSLNKIQALTGASDTAMKRAAATIEANSGRYAKMQQTSTDAAFGVTELAKSGLSLDKALKAVNATMVLAKAGEMDVASASEVVSNTLNTFHLRASKAADIANVLANAANISSADVADLAESLKYVAPQAARSHISLAQTAALMAELANNGIKGSMAGSGLRQVLLRLQAPTGAAAKWLDTLGVNVFDAQGKIKPFGQTIDALRTKLDKLSEKDRAEALTRIFGARASTEAQIIIKGGVKTLADYTRGVQKAGAAEKLANAQSKGLLGTLETIRARATSAGQAFYRKYSPAVDSALKSTLQFADGASKTFGEIPGEAKRLGLEVGIAALVFPRLSSGITLATSAIKDQITYMKVLRLEMADSATRGQALSAGLSRLGGIAKAAAGIGGMVALMDSTHRAAGTMKTLETAAGGAALGFAVGGPLGAGIGGLGGLMFGLFQKTKKVAGGFLDVKSAGKQLADTLNDVTGATTKSTRAMVVSQLSNPKALAELSRLGISMRTATDAIVNGGRARAQVSARITSAINAENAATKHQLDLLGRSGASGADKANQADKINAEHKARLAVLNDLKTQLGLIDKEAAAKRRDAAATASYSQTLLKKVPKSIRTVFEQDGVQASVKNVAALAATYKGINNKQITTMLKLAYQGQLTPDQLKKKLAQVRAAMAAIGRSKVNSAPWLGSLNTIINSGKQAATKGSGAIQRNLASSGHTKIDAGPFFASLTGAVNRAKGIASSGGRGVGSNLKSGLLAGMAGMAQQAAHSAASAVAAAVAAANREGKIKSPSRKMVAVGQFLGDGLVVGILARRARAAKAMKTVVASMLNAATKSRGSLDSFLRKYLDHNTKLSDKEISKRLNGRGKIESSLAKEARQIAKVTKSYKGVNYTLAKATQLLKDRRKALRDYAASVKSAVIGTGDLTQLSVPFTPAGMIAGLQNAVNKARQFRALLDQLKKDKLNPTTLKQITDAGVTGGLATAQALVDGIGTGTIKQVNVLQAQLNQVASHVGSSMSHALNDAGIQAAQALVNGIKKKQKPLIKQFEHLADVLINRLVKGTRRNRGSQNGSRQTARSRTTTNRDSGPSKRASNRPPERLHVSIKLTAQQLSAVQRGKAIQVDLDAYHRSGGRRAA